MLPNVLSEASTENSGSASESASAELQVLVLAGGASRRMGSDKRQLEIAGESLLERTIRQAAKLGFPVLVAGATAALMEHLAVRVREDVRWCEDSDIGRGPIAGILGAASDAPGCTLLVLACDLPLLSVGLLSGLLKEQRSAAADVAVPLTRQRLHPLTAIYSPPALAQMRREAQAGRYSLTSFIHSVSAGELVVRRLGADDLGFSPDQLERELFNCNTTDDWQQARELLSKATEDPRRDQ